MIVPEQLTLIEWLDSCHTQGWYDKGLTVQPLECVSIGFLNDETDDAVTLVMTLDRNGRWSNSITIPKSSITKRWTISH